jgi:hypothetical protein
MHVHGFFGARRPGGMGGGLGDAPDRNVCEVLIEEEMEYQRLRGMSGWRPKPLNYASNARGEGSIRVEDDIVSICDACGGRIGILSSFKRGRGAEIWSTQLHLRAVSWGGFERDE